MLGPGGLAQPELLRVFMRFMVLFCMHGQFLACR